MVGVSVPIEWRPPGWREGLVYRDVAWAPEEIEETETKLRKKGYLTAQRRLTELAKKLGDKSVLSQSIADLLVNGKLLRDAWNTPAKVWRFARMFLPSGVDFRVDPFHNEGAQGLDSLAVILGGYTDETDGFACDDETKFPLYWRGDLVQGDAAAAVNGPHSDTLSWLEVAHAYGQEEFVAAFVPYRGDQWLWNVGFKANIVIHLGRVKCVPAPGISESSPTGSSMLLLWVPESVEVKTLPKCTRTALGGKTYKIPYKLSNKGEPRYVLVQPGNVESEIDLGLLEMGDRE